MPRSISADRRADQRMTMPSEMTPDQIVLARRHLVALPLRMTDHAAVRAFAWRRRVLPVMCRRTKPTPACGRLSGVFATGMPLAQDGLDPIFPPAGSRGTCWRAELPAVRRAPLSGSLVYRDMLAAGGVERLPVPIAVAFA